MFSIYLANGLHSNSPLYEDNTIDKIYFSCSYIVPTENVHTKRKKKIKVKNIVPRLFSLWF